jgi:hypothetical protein
MNAQIKVVAARLTAHDAHALGDVWPNNETSVLCVCMLVMQVEW